MYVINQPNNLIRLSSKIGVEPKVQKPQKRNFNPKMAEAHKSKFIDLREAIRVQDYSKALTLATALQRVHLCFTLRFFEPRVQAWEVTRFLTPPIG
jgi:hypothetical protein